MMKRGLVLLVSSMVWGVGCADDTSAAGGAAAQGGGPLGGDAVGGAAVGGDAAGGAVAGGEASGGAGVGGGNAWMPMAYDDYFVEIDMPAPTTSPVDVAGSSFYANIPYGADEAMRFDFFKPANATSAPLVVFIHGGGFTGGDKTSGYDTAADAQRLSAALEAGVAYASINYRLLDEVDTEGVYKPLSDSRRALQFIRYNASALGIDPSRVVLRGGSAGAGSSLWIAFHDDMQIAAGPDAVAQESTRVLGVAANATQATYDLEKWSSVVFVGYGLDLMSAVAALEMEQRLASFYGLPSTDDLEGQLASPAIVEYRAEVDMLGSMSADDPPFFVHNTLPATLPTDQGVLFHHPYHARALRDRAAEVGVDCTATIEALDIEDSPGESDWEFLLEALGV